MVALKPKTTAQRTPRGVPRAPPEARDVPEARPLQVSQQLAMEEASLYVPPDRNVSVVTYCGKAWQIKYSREACAVAESHCYMVCSAKSQSLYDGLLVLGMGDPHRADASRMPMDLAVNSNARMCRKTSIVSSVTPQLHV